jgi:hypothetical protein
MTRPTLFFSCLLALPLFLSAAEGDHETRAVVESASGSKAAYTQRLAGAQQGASYLYAGEKEGSHPIYERCASCHQSLEPRQKVITYTGSLAGKALAEEKVVVDFETLDGDIRTLLMEIEKLVPFAGEGKRVTLDKTQSYRFMTAFHRMGIHLKTAEEKAAVKQIRAFLAEFTNLTDSAVESFIRFNAPFPDVELRRRVSQVFGGRRSPPDSVRNAFVDMGQAVGISKETMEKWILEAPQTRLTSDEER